MAQNGGNREDIQDTEDLWLSREECELPHGLRTWARTSEALKGQDKLADMWVTAMRLNRAFTEKGKSFLVQATDVTGPLEGGGTIWAVQGPLHICRGDELLFWTSWVLAPLGQHLAFIPALWVTPRCPISLARVWGFSLTPSTSQTLKTAAAAAAKSLQSCPTLCDPIDGSPPGSPVPGILQARTLEWVAISFSNAWKWKVKMKLLSRVRLFATPWTAAYQAPPPMGFSRQEYWSGVPLPSPILKTSTINWWQTSRQLSRKKPGWLFKGSLKPKCIFGKAALWGRSPHLPVTKPSLHTSFYLLFWNWNVGFNQQFLQKCCLIIIFY